MRHVEALERAQRVQARTVTGRVDQRSPMTQPTRLSARELVESNTSKNVEDGAGEDDDEERRAGELYGPPDEPCNESRDPEDVQVDPGGDTDVKRNESVAPESADTVIDGGRRDMPSCAG
jgi:hypothetical protein